MSPSVKGKSAITVGGPQVVNNWARPCKPSMDRIQGQSGVQSGPNVLLDVENNVTDETKK